MVTTAKVCVLCGQDCSSRPRTKNPEGQYACNACLEAKRKANAAARVRTEPRLRTEPEPEGLHELRAHLAEPEPVSIEAKPLDDYDDIPDAMDALLEDLPDQTEVESGSCPSCGMAMAQEAVMCTHCGHNMKTGASVSAAKAPKVKASSGFGAALGSVTSMAGGAVAMLVLAIFGAGVGGALGAGIWAAIAHYAGFEFSLIAILVGGLCGVGAAVATQGRGGAVAGVIAAVMALAAIAGGKYAAVSMAYDEIIGAAPTVNDDVMVEWLTNDLAIDWESEGREIDWKNATSFETSIYPDDYPQDLLDAGEAAFIAMTPIERDDLRASIEAEYAAFEDAVMGVGFVAMWGLLDIVFLLLGVGVAFKAGCGLDG